MLGSHLIRTYSKTQSLIAKSSGESELYACVWASTEGLGIITLLKDFVMNNAKVRFGMDASAAIGMAQRTGLNKVRHVEVDVLWIQEQLARRILPIGKIPGPQNPSDLCAKNVEVALMEQYLRQLYVSFAEGRAAVAQQLHHLRAKGVATAFLRDGDPSSGLFRAAGMHVTGRARASPVVGDPAAGLTGAVGGPRPSTGPSLLTGTPAPCAG